MLYSIAGNNTGIMDVLTPSPHSGPLLGVRRAVLILVANGLFMSECGRLAHDLDFEVNPFWHLIAGVYFVGHALLAMFVSAKGSLPFRFPIDQSFVDVLVVIGAPWV